MSFVTFIRDYIQDPDKIVHIPSFIFDACREFFWYIFSFQWLRNLTYVTLSLAYPEGLSSASKTFSPMQDNGVLKQNLSTFAFGDHVSIPPSLPPSGVQVWGKEGVLSTMVGDFLASVAGSKGFSLSIPYVSETFGSAAQLSTSLESNITSTLTNWSSFGSPLGYGFFNGIISNFHFCAVTIVIAHIILNENKNRAFKIAAFSCLGDLSCMVAVLLGFRRLIIPWFGAEPLGYFLGFAIQFYFALEIIKDNRRIKSSSSSSVKPLSSLPRSPSVIGTKPVSLAQHQGGRLSYNYWLIPGLILFSWCDQTQFFQTLASNGFQPTATLMGLPFVLPSVLKPEWQGGSSLSTAVTSLSPLLPGNAEGGGWHFFTNSGRELQILVYLLTYIITRIVITWIGLSIFQKVIDWKNNNYFRPLNWIYNESKSIIQNLLIFGFRVVNLIPKVKFNPSPAVTSTSERQFFGQSGTLAPPKKVQHLLRDPLAIAAVTCSFAFLPSYSTNLLVTKSVGFFPEENRIKHSFFSPWDMPAEVLASDMDFISSHHNLAEYPFFLPFYDKGDYGGWLGVGEEDVRYGPFRLWQTRRIRAPWRRTTLQEPALTYANDKSLFVNPNPNPRKEESTSITFGQSLGNSLYPKSLSLPTQDNLLNSIDSLASASTFEGGKESISNQGEKYRAKDKTDKGTGELKDLNSDFSWRIPYVRTPEGGKQRGIEEVKPVLSLLRTSKDSSFPFTFDSPLGLEESVQGAPKGQLNSTITKSGQKRLIEGLKKPVRKMSTSKLFNLFSFPLPMQGIESGELPASKKHREGKSETNSPYLPNKYQIGGIKDSRRGIPHGEESNILLASQEENSRRRGFVNTFSKLKESLFKRFSNGGALALLPEVQIKNTKQIRKRFKKFKKRVRLFRSKNYKKRNTKIRRLKHFHYLRNKKKKRRKSRRLIYKLRRQFPYMRNIKERKAEIFGLYSPVSNGDTRGLPYTKGGTSYVLPTGVNKGVEGYKGMYEENSNKTKNAFDYFATTKGEAAALNDNMNNEKSFYDRGYPKTKSITEPKKGNIFSLPFFKDSTTSWLQGIKGTEGTYSLESPSESEAKNKTQKNIKKDFNLIFRTQIGERLEFAQEEIRARIFMNPYIRFLLNKRIDNFLSREKTVFSSENYKETKDNHPLPLQYPEGIRTGENLQRKYGQSAKLTVDAEEKLFKRRLIISKYADAIDFLKPNSRHSYIDRIYNHQFKGTLSTARRLFSLKVQFDQPLVQPTNYEPILEHEDLIQNLHSDTTSYPVSSMISEGISHSLPQKKTEGSYPMGESLQQKNEQPKVKDKMSKEQVPAVDFKAVQSPEYKLEKETKQSGSVLLEKSSSAPFYAAWDSELRKLVFTNRYLDHKLATGGENHTYVRTLSPKAITRTPKGGEEGGIVGVKKLRFENEFGEKNHHQQFTSWPLKESYFKDNEFLVSQLYSNSQPIDSFLSQENEKARPVTLPRRVNSFNTVLSYKNSVPPTDAQRSQQFFKIENNDKKTFLFKHLWTPSNSAESMVPNSKSKENNFVNKNKYKVPTSAEQRKTTRMEEREYPLWMVLRTLAPNQGGFLWPGD